MEKDIAKIVINEAQIRNKLFELSRRWLMIIKIKVDNYCNSQRKLYFLPT